MDLLEDINIFIIQTNYNYNLDTRWPRNPTKLGNTISYYILMTEYLA